MDKLAAVIKREYIERVRNKWFLVATIFGPLLFGAIMILPAWLSIRNIQGARVEVMTVLDATGTDLGLRIVGRLAPAPRDSTPAAKVTADSIAAALRANVFVIAPADLAAEEERYTQRVVANELTGFLVVDSATMSNGT